MVKIKIKDLPKNMKISADELKRVRGGAVKSAVTQIKLTDSNYAAQPVYSLKWYHEGIKWY